MLFATPGDHHMDIKSIGTAVNTALAGDGKISFQEAKDLIAQAKGPEDLEAIRQELNSDAFDTLTKGQRSELEKALGGKLKPSSPAVGKELGTATVNGVKVQVFASKVIGRPEGYDNAFEAQAAARLSRNDQAVVIQQGDKFLVVQTNVPLTQALPPSKQVPQMIVPTGKFDENEYQRLLGNTRTGSDSDKEAAWKKLAAYTYGVPEDQINVIRDSKNSRAGVINLNLTSGNSHTENAGTDSAKFTPGAQSAIEINTSSFIDSAEAQATLLHEGTHLAHDELAQKLYAEYGKDKSKGKQSFSTWVEHHQGLTPEQRIAATDVVANKTSTTEAIAHVDAFIGSFESWKSGSSNALRTFELAGAASHSAATDNKDLKKLQYAKLDAYYHSLPKADRDAFKDAVAYVKSNHPGSWLDGYSPK